MLRGFGIVGISVGMTAAQAAEEPVVAPKPAAVRGTACDICRVPRKVRGWVVPVQDGPAFGPAVSEPLPLPEDAPKAPLAGIDPALRPLLDRYLPEETTDEERRAWSDELRHLPPELARDILSARSRPDEPQPLPTPVPAEEALLPPQIEPEPVIPAEPVRVAQSSPGALAGDATLAALRQAEGIRLHNVANAGTPGFKRLRPVFGEAAGLGGVDEVSAERVELPGELEETGRAFDLAIDGAGMFQVRSGEAVAVTRRGTFRLIDGAVVLVVADEAWSLHPLVQVPAEATEVVVTEQGEVTCRLAEEEGLTTVGRIELARVLDPSHLVSAGGGLLTVPESAGSVTIGLPGAAGFGVVRQGRIERSNVDLKAEMDALDDLRRQIRVLSGSTPLLAAPAGEAPTIRSAEKAGRGAR